jgi:hypothetical protein
MKRIHVSSDALMVGHLEAVLVERGIVCMVRNRYLAGGAGELPPNELWPELWVDDDDEAIARRLVDEILGTTGEPGPDWICSQCGERLEGQFAACWRCGATPD